jgi:hypothetical protein
MGRVERMAKPFILTPRIEEILRTVHYYRYMTALDVAARVFSPASLTHAREILRTLAGGEDCIDNQYLFRFPLPGGGIGKTEKVFTLGSKGRGMIVKNYGKIHVGIVVKPDVNTCVYMYTKELKRSFLSKII